jgi:3-oxoacyl-[acyl-carrier-protein] synthase-3
VGLLGGAGDRIGCFDLNAACSGFVTGLHTADAFLRSGSAKCALVIGGDIFSSILDWSDRGTCVLFGDGAGAAVLECCEGDPSRDSCIIATKLATLPDPEEFLSVKGGGSKHPPGVESIVKPVITMNGREVFKAASRSMVQVAKDVLASAGYKPSDLRWLVPHQANLRIIENVAQMADFPMERVFTNLDRWGNTSAATVAICLAEMQERDLLKKGDLVLLDVFGGGYTYGATLLRW